jgi:predicted KAP-like P-loop ATPase
MSHNGKSAAAKDSSGGQARYSGDYPIQNPTEDKFNRWPFAKRIADTLRDREDPSCIVLGIYGAWGEGKTSVLNIIEAELEKSEKVVVVRFNPWYFSSEAVLIKGLSFPEDER